MKNTVILLLMVSLCCVGQPQWCRERHQGEVLFSEDFAGEVDLSAWHQQGGKQGQWTVRDGRLCSGPCHVGWLNLPAEVHGRNVAIEAELRIVQMREDTRWVSLFARQGEASKQLFVQLPLRANFWSEIAESVVTDKEKGAVGWHVHVARKNANRKAPDAFHTLRMELRDGMASTFIDGAYVAMSYLLKDNDVDGGLGIMVCGVSVEVESLRVEALPGLSEAETNELREVEVGRPLVIGHRGNSAEYPENTLASYLGAVGTGADAVEIDLRLSKDGIPYSFHDDRLGRTVKGSGPISALTMAELKALDAGIHRGEQFAGEKIPTFEEIIQATKGKLGILIDLKEPRAIPAMCELMQRYDVVETTIIATWGEEQITAIRERLPNATVILLTGQLNGEQATFDRLHAIGFDGVFVRLHTPLSFPTYRPRRKAMTTFVWTVNTPAGVTSAWKLGVDGIVTDNPRMVRTKVEELMDRVREW